MHFLFQRLAGTAKRASEDALLDPKNFSFPAEDGKKSQEARES